MNCVCSCWDHDFTSNLTHALMRYQLVFIFVLQSFPKRTPRTWWTRVCWMATRRSSNVTFPVSLAIMYSLLRGCRWNPERSFIRRIHTVCVLIKAKPKTIPYATKSLIKQQKSKLKLKVNYWRSLHSNYEYAIFYRGFSEVNWLKSTHLGLYFPLFRCFIFPFFEFQVVYILYAF